MQMSHLIVVGLVFYTAVALLMARGLYVYRRRDME